MITEYFHDIQVTSICYPLLRLLCLVALHFCIVKKILEFMYLI